MKTRAAIGLQFDQPLVKANADGLTKTAAAEERLKRDQDAFNELLKHYGAPVTIRFMFLGKGAGLAIGLNWGQDEQ